MWSQTVAMPCTTVLKPTSDSASTTRLKQICSVPLSALLRYPSACRDHHGEEEARGQGKEGLSFWRHLQRDTTAPTMKCPTASRAQKLWCPCLHAIRTAIDLPVTDGRGHGIDTLDLLCVQGAATSNSTGTTPPVRRGMLGSSERNRRRSVWKCQDEIV